MSSNCQVAVLFAVLCSVQSFIIQAPFQNEESGNNTIEDEEFSTWNMIEKANANLGNSIDAPVVKYGDIAVKTGLQNADPCTARGCLWPRAPDGNVYIPFRISNQYSANQRRTIEAGLRSFAASTCIRFVRRARQRDFVDIQSRQGCFSFVGRRGGAQVVSLARNGCVFQSIIQHELLHAMGFNHEQTRSDRDQNVRIQLQNVIRGMEFNFRRINTRNLGTPYDYGSVMHYGRFAFSRNRQPTIVPIPNNNVVIGRATQMSRIDILRVNRLYRCNSTAPIEVGQPFDLEPSGEATL